jgi:hypothetical protein
MSTKPKTRKGTAKRAAPGARNERLEPKPSTVAEAVERCKAAQAAYSAAAATGDADAADLHSEAESVTCDELAEMPCTDDAEFIEKLRYLYARELKIFGEPDINAEFGSVVIAVATHLGARTHD